MTKKPMLKMGKSFFQCLSNTHAMQHKRRLLLHKFYFILSENQSTVNTQQEVFNLMI